MSSDGIRYRFREQEGIVAVELSTNGAVFGFMGATVKGQFLNGIRVYIYGGLLSRIILMNYENGD